MKNFSVVILSAGVGKRLYPLTEEYHKSLVPINGKPNLINTLDILEKMVRSIVIVTNEDTFHDHLDVVKSRKWKCKVSVRTNPNASNTNTVTSMLYGLNEIRDRDINRGVMIIEGDQIYDKDELTRMIRKWSHRKSAYFTQYRKNEWKVITKSDKVVGFDTCQDGHCLAGVAFLSKEMALAYEKNTYNILNNENNNQRYWEEFILGTTLINNRLEMFENYSGKGYSTEYDNLYDLYQVLGHDKFFELFDHYEPLDGMTNKTYKVTVNDKNYVLKIPGVGTDKFINRTRELYMSEIFYSNKICPKMTRSGDISIVEFLETSRIVRPTVEDMVRSAKIIGRAHNIKITDNLIPSLLIHDLNQELGNYYRIFMNSLSDHCDDIFYNPDYESITPYVEKVIEDESRCNEVLCQIDLVPNNILVYKGRPKLIDHEYSGILNRYWDLASFFSELYLYYGIEESEELENAFISQYEKTTKFKVNKKEIQKWMVIVDYVWGVWGYAKTEAGQDFLQYGKDRLSKARERLEDLLNEED